jgi:hypothetical protein
MSRDVGELIGSIDDVGPLGDEWAFTLYDDGQEREIAAFAFETEKDARSAADN